MFCELYECVQLVETENNEFWHRRHERSNQYQNFALSMVQASYAVAPAPLPTQRMESAADAAALGGLSFPAAWFAIKFLLNVLHDDHERCDEWSSALCVRTMRVAPLRFTGW